MKPWDGLDRETATPLRLSPRDRQVLLNALDDAHTVRIKRKPAAHGGSLIGLVLSVALLAGLTWALWPSSPVAPELLR